MTLEYDNKLKRVTINQEDDIVIQNYIEKPYPILTELLGYTDQGISSYGINMTKEVLDKYYEEVTNFSYVKFEKETETLSLYRQVYKDKELDFFILVIKDLDRSWIEEEEVIEEGVFAIANIYYKAGDGYTTTRGIDRINKYGFIQKDSSNKISLVLRIGNNTVFKEHKIKPLEIDIDTMYNDDFKPVHEHIVENLRDKQKGIFLFHGAAGTGKTNYIKNLTNEVPKKRFVFVPVGVIPHLADPEFISLLIDNKGAVLVLEDCENFIKDRGQSGSNVVSTILNLSDGILSDVLGIQIICTFNADIGKIDEALRRKGRLVDEYEFGKLSLSKAKALGETVGVEITEEMTLSEVFNAKDNSNRVEVKCKKIGFGN